MNAFEADSGEADPGALGVTLGELDWLQRLARSLVRDPHLADDAVQATLVAALERRAPAGRGWLATVLRNFVRREGRSGERRRERERAGARPEGGPSTDDLAARLELQERVLQAVRNLAEPYRTTIAQRYLDGLAPREIARRRGVPVNTVRTHLDRGLAKLRGELDREFGERSAWALALIPLCEGTAATPLLPWLAGLPAGVKLVGAGAALAALTWLALPDERELAPEPAAAPASIEASAMPADGEPIAPGGSTAGSGSAREALGGEASGLPPVDPSPRERPSEEWGRLSVFVRGASHGLPISGVALVATDSMGNELVTGSTDDRGLVELVVPSRRALVLSARPPRPEDPLDPVARGELAVGALVAGESRELVIALTHGLDGRFYGRAVSAGGDPLRDVRVQPLWGEKGRGREAMEVRTGADGSFEVDHPTWRTSAAELVLQGYGPTFVKLGPELSSPGAPFHVVLVQAATLEALVTLDGRTPHSLTVQVETDPGGLVQPVAGAEVEAPAWSVLCDAGGAARIEGLPAGVPLQLSFWSGDELLWREPKPLRLAPGEVRHEGWELARGAVLAGTVRDQHLAAVTERELWLVPADPAVEGSYFEGLADRMAARAVTDAAGRYQFEGVPAGAWWVGPSPARFSRTDVAAFGTRVVVEPGVTRQLHDLCVHRELTIRGRVRMPPEARGRGSVLAELEGSGGSVRATFEESGAFEIGPLMPGRYHLRAYPYAMLSRDGTAKVQAGAQEVLLDLSGPDYIAGRTVDADGQPVVAHVHLITRRGSYGMRSEERGLGRFVFGGIDPGEYVLQASTADGRVAVQQAVVEPGHPTTGVVLRVADGGRVRMHYRGEAKGTRAAVYVGGLRVADSTLRSGEFSDEEVPAGPVTLQLYSTATDEVVDEIMTELAAGGFLEVEFQDG